MRPIELTPGLSEKRPPPPSAQAPAARRPIHGAALLATLPAGAGCAVSGSGDRGASS